MSNSNNDGTAVEADLVENDAGGATALFSDALPRSKDEDVLTAAEAVVALTSTESDGGETGQNPPEMDRLPEVLGDEAAGSAKARALEPPNFKTDETTSETDDEKVIIVPNFVDDPIILHVHSKQAKPKSKDDLLPEVLLREQVTEVSDTQRTLPQNITESADSASYDHKEDAVINTVSNNENDLNGGVVPDSNYSMVEKTASTSTGNKTIAAESNESTVVSGEKVDQKQIKLVDYASKLAGAQILEHSSSFKGASNLLTGDKDKYSIAPCEDEKYVVLGLSEDILVKKVKLSNYERYSSRVKKFEVLASQEYPTPTEEHWNSIGIYEAQSKSGEQVFELENPTWARYLVFRFLSHFGSEHYCTLSQIKVHGSTMLQGFHEQWAESEKKDLEMEHGGGKVEVRDELVEVDITVKSDDISLDGEDKKSHDEEDMPNVGVAGEIIAENNNIDEQQKSRDLGESTTAAKLSQQVETINEEVLERRPLEEVKGTTDYTPPQESTTEEREARESNDEESSIINETVHDDNESLAEINAGLHLPRSVGDSEEEKVPLDLNESHVTGAISDNDSESTHTRNQNYDIPPDADKDSTIQHESQIGGSDDGHIRSDSSIVAVKDVVKTVVADASDAIKNATRGTIKNVKDAILTSVTSNKVGNSVVDIMNATMGEVKDDHTGKVAPSESTSQKLARSIPDHETSSNVTARDNVKTEVGEAFIKEDTADNDSRLKIEPTISKKDSTATAGRDLLQKTIVAGKEMEATRLFSTLSRRFPNAKCLKDLDFQAFKAKTLLTGTGGSMGGMEPIFTKITTEIKSVQNTQHLYEQYTTALKACYEEVFWDIANDLDSMQSSFDRMLSRLDVTEKQQNNLPPSVSKLFSFIAAAFYSGSTFEPRQTTFLFASTLAIFLLLVRSFIRSKIQAPRERSHNVTAPKPAAADINVSVSDNDVAANELDDARARLAEKDEELRLLQEQHTSLQQRYSQREQTISVLERVIEQLTPKDKMPATRNGYTTPPPTAHSEPSSSGIQTISPTDDTISKEQDN